MSPKAILDKFEEELKASDMGDVAAMAMPLRHMYAPETLVAMLDALLTIYAKARGARVTLPEEAPAA